MKIYYIKKDNLYFGIKKEKQLFVGIKKAGGGALPPAVSIDNTASAFLFLLFTLFIDQKATSQAITQSNVKSFSSRNFECLE